MSENREKYFRNQKNISELVCQLVERSTPDFLEEFSKSGENSVLWWKDWINVDGNG